MKSTKESVFAKRIAKTKTKTEKVEVSIDEKLAPFVTRFTKSKIDEWKQQFAGRELIYIKHEDQLAVLRPPTAKDISDYMMAIGTDGMDVAVAMIIEQLWIEGDFSLIEDEDRFIGVFLQVNNILEGKKVEFFRA